MRMFIKNEVIHGAQKNYALIVPTKALINEVRGKVIDDLGDNGNLEKINYLDRCNYPSYLLTNNNANIRRTRQRIEDLKSQSEYSGWAFPGGRAEINEGENRLQLFFEEKPSEEQRRELKSNGFKWAPSQGAWQRQLTKNAIYAAGRMEFLRPEDGQSPYQLQPFARKTEKDMTR